MREGLLALSNLTKWMEKENLEEYFKLELYDSSMEISPQGVYAQYLFERHVLP